MTALNYGRMDVTEYYVALIYIVLQIPANPRLPKEKKKKKGMS